MKFLMELALLIILMPIFAIIYYMIEKIGDYKAARNAKKRSKK